MDRKYNYIKIFWYRNSPLNCTIPSKQYIKFSTVIFFLSLQLCLNWEQSQYLEKYEKQFLDKSYRLLRITYCAVIYLIFRRLRNILWWSHFFKSACFVTYVVVLFSKRYEFIVFTQTPLSKYKHLICCWH